MRMTQQFSIPHLISSQGFFLPNFTRKELFSSPYLTRLALLSNLMVRESLSEKVFMIYNSIFSTLSQSIYFKFYFTSWHNIWSTAFLSLWLYVFNGWQFMHFIITLIVLNLLRRSSRLWGIVLNSWYSCLIKVLKVFLYFWWIFILNLKNYRHTCI